MAHGCHCANTSDDSVPVMSYDRRGLVEAYLARLGVDRPTVRDRDALTALVRSHHQAIPFTNVAIVAGQTPALTVEDMLVRVVEQGRGGWCFELNGALGWLLTELGFSVRFLGAAVLLDGPATLIDHMMLEVTVDRPLLVDVGFGDSFLGPLDLTSGAEHDDDAGRFGFLPSRHGTTLARWVEGVPEAQYRFTRMRRELADFAPVAQRLAGDPAGRWRQRRLATRWLGVGDDRVTLTEDRLLLRRDGQRQETLVAAKDWSAHAEEWFGLPPESWSVGIDHGQ